MEDIYDLFLMEARSIFLNNLYTETCCGLDACSDLLDIEREPLETDSQLRGRCLEEYKQIRESTNELTDT